MLTLALLIVIIKTDAQLSIDAAFGVDVDVLGRREAEDVNQTLAGGILVDVWNESLAGAREL